MSGSIEVTPSFDRSSVTALPATRFISYAQNQEDVLLWRALQAVGTGFYVDVGALDPVVDSVTQAFSERGWRGINVEPGPAGYAALAAARQRDVNLHVAAGRSRGVVQLHEVGGSAGLSSVEPLIAHRHEKAGFSTRVIEVEQHTLAEILDEYAADIADIHFLKIDVEGVEADVLAGMDFVRFRPWILIVESTEPNSPNLVHEAWDPDVLAADYRFAWFDGLNRFYIAAERWDDLADHFNAPPNVLDNWVRATEIAAVTGAATAVNAAHHRVGAAEAAREAAEAASGAARQRADAAELARVAAQAGSDAAHQRADAAEAAREAARQHADTETAARVEAQAARDAAEHRAELAEATLAAIRASTFWRITAPLRFTVRVGRRLVDRALRLSLRIARKIVRLIPGAQPAARLLLGHAPRVSAVIGARLPGSAPAPAVPAPAAAAPAPSVAAPTWPAESAAESATRRALAVDGA